MTEAVSTSDITVNFYQTTRHNFPEDAGAKSWSTSDGAINRKMNLVLNYYTDNLQHPGKEMSHYINHFQHIPSTSSSLP
jgi:hypothetical protein